MPQNRILVIDDDRIILDMLKLALERAEYEVTTALDGAEGLRLFREKKPDLVIADIAMPGIDGYQIVAQVREADRDDEHTPVIILTAHEQSVMRAYAAELGADLYLTKPVTPRVLTDHIGRLLAAPSETDRKPEQQPAKGNSLSD
jgi:DNA-binding response OmpR family regulator